MRIADSRIAMFGVHTYLEKYEKSESLKMWVGEERPDFEGRKAGAARLPEAKDYILELSGQVKAAKPAILTGPAGAAEPVEKKETDEFSLSEEDKMKITLVEKIIEMLTGKKVKIKVPQIKTGEGEDECGEMQEKAAALKRDGQDRAPQKQGWGLEYDYHEMRYEQEKMTFEAEGIIRTVDGREIKFSVDLSMSREFMEEKNISVRAGDAVKIDPLVINFNGPAAGLTETKFSFDLDANGKEEQISFVSSGSGFLVLDRNNDGVINNGSELFGPQSGNGFAELANYDEDGNQWIDENDSIFSKLRIWSKDAQGNDFLFALGQKGVGAIYLGHITTLFDMKNRVNELQGQVQRTGVFVKEKGSLGTVQQIDLAV